MSGPMVLARFMAAVVASMALAAPASAATVRVAVAANFSGVAGQLARAFEARTGDEVQLSSGSSGTLYAQISQGAPFEIFLSADTERPERAVAEGLGVEGSTFVYALGRLVLYSTSLDVTDGEAALRAGKFRHLAVADARAAPYGAAALETIEALGLTGALAPRLVVGQSVAQALQFVTSGNAELGFVALSLVAGGGGSQWRVPDALHEPIEQGAVLLNPGRDDPAARAFLAFLRGPEAAKMIERAGYGAPP